MILGGLQIFAGGLIGGVWLIFIGMFLRGMAEGSYLELTLRYGSAGLVARRADFGLFPALRLSWLSCNQGWNSTGAHLAFKP